MRDGEGVARARAGDGPTLVEAKTFRMGGHSTSDDPSRYVAKELFTEWEAKDPIQRFEKYLAAAGLWTPEAGAALAKDPKVIELYLGTLAEDVDAERDEKPAH